MARTEHTAEDTALSRKLGPLPVWAWAAIGVGIALFFNKKKSSSSSSASNSGSPFGYSLASQDQAAALGAQYGSRYPIGYSDYSSGADLAGVLQQLSSQVSALGGGNSGTNQTPAVSPGNTQTGAANQTAPKPSPGFGAESIGGMTYDILGINSAAGPQGFSGYNVSGGAPVYYLAPGSTTPQQGTSAAVLGATVLTPSIYGGQISSTPTHQLT